MPTLPSERPSRTLLILLACLAAPLEGQQTAPLILRAPASPRAFGFGDAFAGGAGADVVFYNPAQIGVRTGLFGTVSRYAGASTQASIASSTALGKVAVAAFGQWLDYGSDGFPARPGGLTERGGDLAASIAGGLALATQIKGFRVGAAAKYVEERVPGSRSGVAAFDIGISRALWRLTVALVAQHLGPDLELGATTVELPTRVTLGATSRLFPIGTFFDLAASAAVARERGGRITPGGGLELRYEPLGGWTASLRVGARRVDGSGRPALQPLTLGASLGLDRISLDYGFESYRGPGAVHRVGIRIE